jgi:HSP20 family protein
MEHSTDDKVKCLQLEINYGDFYRSIPLPPQVDPENASAKSKDGFLLIFIPFKKSKRIPVEEG